MMLFAVAAMVLLTRTDTGLQDYIACATKESAEDMVATLQSEDIADMYTSVEMKEGMI